MRQPLTSPGINGIGLADYSTDCAIVGVRKVVDPGDVLFRCVAYRMIPRTPIVQRHARRLSPQTWLLCLLLTTLTIPFPGDAVGVEITILKSSELKAYNDAIDGFKATAPHAAIYAEYDLRGDLERGKQLARKIRSSDTTLVVAVGLKAALVAKLEISDTPILYMMILDPVKHHLTANNLTGVLLDVPLDSQLKTMRTLLPSVHRIGMLFDPAKSASKFKEAQSLATQQNLHLSGFPVEDEKEVPQQLRALLATSEVLWLIPDSTVVTDESTRFILESALSKRIPVIGFSSELTRLGALLSLSVSNSEIGREAGHLAKRILDGDKPMPLKPVSVQRAKLAVNLKTARYLSITIPRDLDSRIDETY